MSEVDIDWSQAPADATHFSRVNRYWYKAVNGMLLYNEGYGAGPGWTASTYGLREQPRLGLIERGPFDYDKTLKPFATEEEVLLPSNWGSITPEHRRTLLLARATATLEDDPILREYMKRLLADLDARKLFDVADDDLTKAYIVVAMMPTLPVGEPIDWEHVNAITHRQLALLDKGRAHGTDAYARLLDELLDVKYEPARGRQFPADGYERLHDVYRDAHDQAAYDKGKERHANDLPFHEQRMQTISQGLDSPDGMAYQVIKKLQEGLQMPDAGARRRELLGALNYLAGIVIFLDDREDGGVV